MGKSHFTMRPFAPLSDPVPPKVKGPQSSLSKGVDEGAGRLVTASDGSSGRALLITLSIGLFLLLLLEYRFPYYFLQDDNLEYFLPLYFHNWQSLLAGRFPFYDFHIYAGIPHAARGLPAVFYLPLYAAFLLSEAIWGHVFATMDLLSILHVLIAVAGGYVLLRWLGTTTTVAAFGALTALSGYLLWCGRLWITSAMLCAWFPWMLWAALRYMEKPTAGRAGWLVLFRLCLLFGGYPQFFVLAMIFEHLFALGHSVATQRRGWMTRCLGYLSLDLPTVLLALPFLLPMWGEVGRSLDRSRPLSYSEFSALSIPPTLWFFGQLFFFIKIQLPKHIVIARSIPYVSYIGYLPALLPLGAGVYWRKRPGSRPWLIACGVCFVIALLWCWNVLGPLIYHLPVLNRFRWPFKLIYFAGFFQCLIAALVLTLFSRRWQRVAVACLIVNWIAVFCFLPNHAWRTRKYDLPLNSPWQESVRDGRYLVISRSPVTSDSNEYLERNFSEFWGLDNLLGYEPLVPRLNGTVLLGRPMTDLGRFGGGYDGPLDQQLLDHFKLWSVKYALLGPTRAEDSGKLAEAGYRKREEKQGWTLWEDPDALPRVRWGDVGTDPGAGIRWVEQINSIDVDLSQWPGRQLIFAFAANHGLETCVGGRCTAVGESPDGLVRVDVPPGTQHVQLVYHNALFLPSVVIAIVTLLLYCTLLFRSRRANRKGGGGQTEVLPVIEGPGGE